MPRKVYGWRGLLNLPGHGSSAAIVAEIEDTSGWPEGKGRDGEELSRYNFTPHSSLIITDCDNKVSLEIDLETENEVTNTLHKIDEMINALTELREGVEIEGPRAVARRAQIPEERKYGLA
jgi:hypothetical protein